jgi:hypothetical protein
MIDIGEKWAAVLGVEPVLDQEMPRIYAEDRKRVDNFEVEIMELADKVCGGSSKLNWPNVPGNEKIGQKLAQSFKEDDIVKLIARLPQDAKLPYKDVAMHQFMFLAKAFPRSTRSTLTGPIPVDPSSIEMFRFDGLYRIVDNPLYVLSLMGADALLQNQVQACRNLFPSISMAIDAALRQSWEDHKVKNKSYEVPYKADSGIRQWLGMPILIAPYQATYLTAKEKINAQPQPSRSQYSPESKASMSAAQSALYSTVGK